MGNKQGETIKIEAHRKREEMLQEQMKVIHQSLQKFAITPEKAEEIVKINVHQAVTMLNRGELTSEVLLTALALRASMIAKNLNIFTATDFSSSLATAIACDTTRKQTGKRNWTFEDGEYNPDKFLPPLYGIPISIKDVFHVDSMTTTLGLISKSKNYEPEEGLIKCIKNSGMIPYIKTNIPQLGMAAETNNNLWGRTVNPWNRDRACGGSSGGEGAIVSSQCSLIGIGSDIGGSIRIPAEFCGVFGLKPCSKRISAKYHATFSRAFYSFGQSVPLCIGPLAKSTRDLALFMDVVTNRSFYQGSEDPYVPIIPFNKNDYLEAESGKRKYRIGYMKSLEDFEPSVASTRALNETIKLLQEEGHELIEIKIPNEKEVIRNFVAEYSSARGQIFREILQGETPIPEYKSSLLIQEMWAPTYWLVSNFAKMFMPRTYTYVFERKMFSSIIEYQRHMGEISELKAEWISYWKKNQLDLVICPGFGCQAFLHAKSDLLSVAAAYTFIWNVLDMPAGSVPITLVQENEQHYESRYDDLITKEFRQVAANSRGLPVGVQVIGLPFEEEKILGVMSRIEKQVRFYEKFPLPKM